MPEIVPNLWAMAKGASLIRMAVGALWYSPVPVPEALAAACRASPTRR